MIFLVTCLFNGAFEVQFFMACGTCTELKCFKEKTLTEVVDFHLDNTN